MTTTTPTRTGPRPEHFEPLAGIWSLKMKVGLLIVAAVGVAVAAMNIGWRVGLPVWFRPPIAIVISLAMVHVLARGTTYPLREMSQAAGAMATGDYSQRVTAASADEVGELGRAFNQMAADLEQVERQRRELVANVSHELRTPLAALQLQLENMVDGVTEPTTESLDVMLAQSKRLSRLVVQLLDLSQLESGGSPLAYGSFAVEPMLRRAAVEAQLQRDDVKITVDADPELLLHGDMERLHQVMANLLENAMRYATQQVTITASQVGDRVQLSVADDGPGIEAADRDRIFERFARADAARSRKRGGAGLGLSIARWIVDLHDGEIHVEPNSPRGARFVATLPMQK